MVQEMRHPKSLDFKNERKVMHLRGKGLSFKKIATLVRNLQKRPTTKEMCRQVSKDFSPRLGRRPYQYANCGRTAKKMTQQTKSFLVKKVREHRNKRVCTSTFLQRLAKKELGLTLDASHIRKALREKGYFWLARKQLRKYNKKDRALRYDFAKRIADLTPAEACKRLRFAMDGVVLTRPPTDEVDRANYCSTGDTHVYMKRIETKLKSLTTGKDKYQHQVPPDRIVPLWGGISVHGFAPVTWHKQRKLNGVDWTKVLVAGALKRAIESLKPDVPGLRHILCDNESFLRCKAAKPVYKAQKMKLMKLPPRSPDLNPVERFWGWLRKALLSMDLKDLHEKRPVPGKVAYRERIRRLLKTKRAQTVAANYARSWHGVCKLVVKNKGGASGK